MKFVCDHCNTKYSIADEKVRRKVLKIRCKNCSQIIVVREPGAGSSETEPLDPEPSGTKGPLDRTIDEAPARAAGTGFRGVRMAQSAPALKVTPSLMAAAEPDEFEAAHEHTRLSGTPDFVEAAVLSGAAVEEDEWYFAVDGNQFGPMGFPEICSRVKRGEALGDAYVWRDGFDDWLELQDVPELRPFLPRHPPPPPRGKSGLIQASSLVGGTPLASSLPSRPYQPKPPFPTLPRAGAIGMTPGRGPAPIVPGSVAPPSFGGRNLVPPSMPPMPALPAPPPGAAPEDLVPSDSGLVPLPISPAASLPASGPLPPLSFAGAEPSGYQLLAATVPPAARPSSTPLLLKVTAAAGIASLLCGIGLVAYFVFFDRPAKPARIGIPLPTSEPGSGPTATPQPAPPRPPEPQEFQPMEIGRSAHAGKAPTRAAPAHKESQAPPPAAPGLSDKQRRLLALYGQGGEAPTDAPAPAVPAAKPSGPRRQISENDIINMQRKHRPALTACYDRALKRDDTLSELKADVTVTIDDRGLVKGVAIQGVRDDELASCLRKNIRYWAFQPLGEQTFRFPIIFRGS